MAGRPDPIGEDYGRELPFAVRLTQRCRSTIPAPPGLPEEKSPWTTMPAMSCDPTNAPTCAVAPRTHIGPRFGCEPTRSIGRAATTLARQRGFPDGYSLRGCPLEPAQHF